MSKKLESILNKVPHATVPTERFEEPYVEPAKQRIKEETSRIVAVIPKSLKKQIKQYLDDHPEETERNILLKGLKKTGFLVEDSWIVDKRRTR